MNAKLEDGAAKAAKADRRSLFKAALGGLVVLGARRSGAQPPREPRKLRPQEGDVFVFGLGDREGETVRVPDLVVDGPAQICYSMEPESGVVRDGSRLNQVLLVRCDPGELSEETAPLAAEGVVAYSAICPHTGCDVSMWRGESRNLLCSCHDSEFDPRNSAVVETGPAPRRLPALPLTMDDGVLKAAGGFNARIRFQREL